MCVCVIRILYVPRVLNRSRQSVACDPEIERASSFVKESTMVKHVKADRHDGSCIVSDLIETSPNVEVHGVVVTHEGEQGDELL